MLELNPATTALLAALAAVKDSVDNVRETLERRENQSPGLQRLSSTVFSTSKRFRVTHFVLSVSAAGVYGLRVGTSDVFQVQTAGADTIAIPLPITIDSGKEISISGTAVNITDAFIVGFTDYPEGEF